MALTGDDINAIHTVLSTYGHIVDDHDWERGHEVFADDFVFDRSSFGQPDLNGLADIQATFLGRNMYAHFTGNVTLQEQPDGTVRAHSKFIGFPNEGQPVTGDYDDILVKTAVGWRLQRRSATVRQRKFFE